MEWNEYCNAVNRAYNELPHTQGVAELERLKVQFPNRAPAHMKLGMKLWDSDRTRALASFRDLKTIFAGPDDLPRPIKITLTQLGVLDNFGNWMF